MCNQLTSVALTSVVAKCFERLVCNQLTSVAPTSVVAKCFERLVCNQLTSVALTSVVAKCFERLVCNQLTSVALTSVVAKCFERLVCNQLTSVAVRLDPLQFAYRVEDATLTLVNLITNHLDTTGSCVRVLLMEFSSAFISIQLRVLLQRFWI